MLLTLLLLTLADLKSKKFLLPLWFCQNYVSHDVSFSFSSQTPTYDSQENKKCVTLPLQKAIGYDLYLHPCTKRNQLVCTPRYTWWTSQRLSFQNCPNHWKRILSCSKNREKFSCLQLLMLKEMLQKPFWTTTLRERLLKFQIMELIETMLEILH